MTVKADSKGRLTGATPGEEYEKRESSNGTISYVPKVPKEFHTNREVTWDEFTEFFGVAPDKVVEDGVQVVRTGTQREGYIPSRIMVTEFVTDANNSRMLSAGEVMKRDTVIYIKKQREG